MIRVGDRVKLSKLGADRILGEIVRGKLKDGLRRRSCNNRKLTEFSVGTVLKIKHGCAKVVFDHIWNEYWIVLDFLRKTLRVIQ